MAAAFFEKLKICLSPKEMVPLICESFSRKELVRLIASAGVVYPGVRMETLPPEELALGWVEDAWNDPDILGGLVKALDKAHRKDIELMGLMSPGEMSHMPASVEDLCRRRKIDGLIWALLRDGRADAALVRMFLESFYRFLDKGVAEFKQVERFENHLLQGKLGKKETQKMLGMLTNLIEENKELKRDRKTEIKNKNKMMRQSDALKKKTAADRKEIAALKNELAGLRKETARKDTLLREFEDRVKTISRDEEETLRRRIHGLEREERKLRHDIADLHARLSAARQETQAAQDRCRDLQRAFQEERFKREHLEREAKQLALKAGPPAGQAAGFGQSGQASAKKGSPPPKERGRRLGVFVDTRHLWRTSQLLGQKIDYQKLLEFIVFDRHLVKALAYTMTAPDRDSGGFLAMLGRTGFHVRCRPFSRWADGSLHGSWGAGIAADVIFFCEKLSLDIVHLVSDSEDFADLLKLIKARGLRTEVSGFKDNAAPHIERVADEFISLDARIFRDSA